MKTNETKPERNEMSLFTEAGTIAPIASCDERIASIQQKLNAWKSYKGVMGLMSGLYEKEEEKELFTKSEYFDKIKTYENNIKLVEIEKLIYKALVNPNSKPQIFKLLLQRYDELMGVSYDLSGNMVITGLNTEGDHLEYCKESLGQREYIKKLCFYGEHR